MPFVQACMKRILRERVRARCIDVHTRPPPAECFSVFWFSAPSCSRSTIPSCHFRCEENPSGTFSKRHAHECLLLDVVLAGSDQTPMPAREARFAMLENKTLATRSSGSSGPFLVQCRAVRLKLWYRCRPQSQGRLGRTQLSRNIPRVGRTCL